MNKPSGAAPVTGLALGFTPEAARSRIHEGQLAFIDRLLAIDS
ncbi:hypothetical protein QTI66_37040 [Variovorax sp. J22R133]|nr:hypothetical protein [Variovorax sp. J22R133]MDM0117713.1 hypothetical protein [Variovorax sp. J22R133]